MQSLLAALGTEHYIMVGFDTNRTLAICIRNDGHLVKLPLDEVVIHGTAPAHWYTNECANTCNHPARDYHCNHVSWAQMWTY